MARSCPMSASLLGLKKYSADLAIERSSLEKATNLRVSPSDPRLP